MSTLFAMSLPGLVVLLFVLAILDQIAVKAGRTKWIPWRGGKRAGQISATGFDQLHAAVVPGKDLELEQRRSTAMMREDEDSGAPPNGVDLDAGVFIVKRPRD
ncbi:DUF6191 domain-containing protein [Phytomonospora endophytica]|uniref:Uncharacterized protein n=1 Tax=Phytomonospora endophytica TaxID=714109 RepID=A0A841FGG7_9ACTN|nr:DUF6191 domain-containing protein [Phytomonospora endophytica]MBB6035336.1 hypothetical protein [Phytomonospora endophytica]GIG63914.1 hypothetical protein Pen01_02090 [Phytomonospora endophytica]